MVRITNQSSGEKLINLVEKMSNVDLKVCYQCKKCSSGCPVSKLTKATPSEIVRRLHLGAGKELLESDLVWMCLSCETCFARCPMKINIAAVIDALRALAVQYNAPKPEGNMPLFNRLFLNSVKNNGRSYELPMLVSYKLRTFNIKQDTGKLPAMLKKGKMAILPPSGADKKMVKQIFKRVKQNNGDSK
ncbi:MAG: 4Fe-4S dicluster domain-containing protein [Chloroflexi bacterium]|nr:4Fe-4S dicluster domain-containing protein [Chloroflexota bacterium]